MMSQEHWDLVLIKSWIIWCNKQCWKEHLSKTSLSMDCGSTSKRRATPETAGKVYWCHCGLMWWAASAGVGVRAWMKAWQKGWETEYHRSIKNLARLGVKIPGYNEPWLTSWCRQELWEESWYTGCESGRRTITGSAGEVCGESVESSGCQAVLTLIWLYRPSIKQKHDYTLQIPKVVRTGGVRACVSAESCPGPGTGQSWVLYFPQVGPHWLTGALYEGYTLLYIVNISRYHFAVALSSIAHMYQDSFSVFMSHSPCQAFPPLVHVVNPALSHCLVFPYPMTDAKRIWPLWLKRKKLLFSNEVWTKLVLLA